MQLIDVIHLGQILHLLQAQVEKFEETLKSTPADRDALEVRSSSKISLL